MPKQNRRDDGAGLAGTVGGTQGYPGLLLGEIPQDRTLPIVKLDADNVPCETLRSCDVLKNFFWRLTPALGGLRHLPFCFGRFSLGGYAKILGDWGRPGVVWWCVATSFVLPTYAYLVCQF